MKEPQIQIPRTLFNEILIYFGGDKTTDRELRIRDGIDKKIDAAVRHDYYSEYKTAPTAEQREKARQNYLDAAGIPQSFRW